MENLAIKVLATTLKLNIGRSSLENAGVSIEFLGGIEDNLFDAVLDEIGFKKAGTKLLLDGEEYTINREYLYDYFYTAIKKNKGPEKIFNDLLEIYQEENHYGINFDITPWLS